MQNYAGVYKIENLDSGKIYIGSTKRFRSRFTQHSAALRKNRHQNKHLQSAWNLYGEAKFAFVILVVCPPSLMRDYEQVLLDTLSPAYNQTASAYSGIPFGAKLSTARKEELRARSIDMWGDPMYRATTTEAINKAMTADECSKRSTRVRVLWADPEYRAKAIAARSGNAYNKGYKCTPEQVLNRKKAARISNMKRNYGDEWRVEYIRRYPEFIGDTHE